MTKKYQEETNDRTRYNLHLPNEVMSLIQKWYKDDGCTTMNEFVLPINGKVIGQEQEENSVCGSIPKAKRYHLFQGMWTVMLRIKIIR